MTKLMWQVKLVAEREPGVTTETELARIERDEQASLAELGLTLAETKQLTAALQAEIVPAQMTALSASPRACAACGHRLAAKGHYGATFRSLFGDVPVRVRRWFVCLCQGASEAKSVAALDFGGDGVAPELAYVTAPTRQRRPQAGSSGGVIAFHDLACSRQRRRGVRRRAASPEYQGLHFGILPARPL